MGTIERRKRAKRTYMVLKTAAGNPGFEMIESGFLELKNAEKAVRGGACGEGVFTIVAVCRKLSVKNETVPKVTCELIAAELIAAEGE